MSKSISFSAETEADREYLKTVAREKGHGSVSNMARFAVYQYLNRIKCHLPSQEAFTDRESTEEGEL